MRKLLVLFLFFLGILANARAQPGGVTGTITDPQGEPIIGAAVVLLRDAKVQTGVVTDENGCYTLRPIEAGRYCLRVSYMDFKTALITNLIVPAGRLAKADLKMVAGMASLKTQEIETVLWNSNDSVVATECPQYSSDYPHIVAVPAPGLVYYIDGKPYYANGEPVKSGASKAKKRPFWQRLRFWK